MSFNEREFHFFLIFGDKNVDSQQWSEEEWLNMYEPALVDSLNEQPAPKNSICSVRNDYHG